MTTPSVQTTVRSDADILADIHNVIAYYPPLAHDRHHLTTEVRQGAVQIVGVVKSPVTYEFLLDKLPKIEGVKSVDSSHLFHDEGIRLEIGKLGLLGVFIIVEYGSVKLTGKLPPDMTLESLVGKISAVNGVKRVVAALN